MARSTMTYEERIQKMDQKEQEISEKLRQYQAKKCWAHFRRNRHNQIAFRGR